MASTRKKSAPAKISKAKKVTKTKKTASAVSKKTAEVSAQKTKQKTTAEKTPSKKTAIKKSLRKNLEISSPKTILKPKNSKWWSVLTFGVIALGVAVAGFLSFNPVLLGKIQANLMAQVGEQASNVEEEQATGTPAQEEKILEGGVLISRETGGENEGKLRDIFRTVFPETAIKEIQYETEEGQKLIKSFGVEELPAIFYEKEAFEKESLSEVVKELFLLKEGHYMLNVSLVNPSYQLRIKGPLKSEGAVIIGEENAPLKLYLYSEPKCQQCRVNEQNNLNNFKALAEEGIAQLIFLDLPRTPESSHHSVALACVGKNRPDRYMDFREMLFDKANLSVAYTDHLLEQEGLDYEADCDAPEVQKMLRARLRSAEEDGITGVPAMYIRKSGEEKAIRITGAKNFSEYEAVFDELLGKSN